MKRALVIRHDAAETLARNFTSVLQSENFQLEPLNIFKDAPEYRLFPAPPLDEISLIIALGGPMSANDDYPALRQECEYLRNAMDSGKPVLGIWGEGWDGSMVWAFSLYSTACAWSCARSLPHPNLADCI